MTTESEELQFMLLDHINEIGLRLRDHVAQQAILDAVKEARMRAWAKARETMGGIPT